jgi:hypothetical protein
VYKKKNNPPIITSHRDMNLLINIQIKIVNLSSLIDSHLFFVGSFLSGWYNMKSLTQTKEGERKRKKEQRKQRIPNMFIDQFKWNTTSSRCLSERNNEVYEAITRDTNCAMSCSFNKKSIDHTFDHMQI